MDKEQQRLFIVIQNNNPFDENHFEGYLWAENHNDANEKAKTRYPDGYLVVEIKQEGLINILSVVREKG